MRPRLWTWRGRSSLLMGFLFLFLVLAACSSSPGGDEPVPQWLSWINADVGSVGLQGGFEQLGTINNLLVKAAGEDIWGVQDSFHYVYVAVAGDFSIQARVDGVSFTHDWAKAGLMLRQSLDPGSPHAFVGLTPNGAVEMLRRLQANQQTVATVDHGWPTPSWVRLQREGRIVTAWVSLDQLAWNQVDQVDLGWLGEEELLLGVAVTSHDSMRLTEARIRQLRLGAASDVGPGDEPGEPSPEPPPPAPEDPPPPGPDPQPPVPVSDWVCGSEPLTPRYQPTLFVDGRNGSDNNDGRSVDRAFSTLQRAARVVQPGDVVWVRGGVYSGHVVFERSGTANAPIVFESYPGECAILDGSGHSRLERAQFWNLEYNVFRNFIVRNSPGEGIFLSNVNRSIFSNLRVHHSAMSGILSMYGNDNLFTMFITHDNFDPPNGGDADGISVASGSGNRISRCIAYRNSDDGVDTWLSTDSVVEYCASFDNGYQGGDGNGFKAGGDGRQVNTIVRYSVAFNNRANGFDWNTGRGVTFDQNTAYANGLYGIAANGGATVRNNLSIGNGRDNFSGNPSQVTLGANSWSLGILNGGFLSTDRLEEAFLSLSAGSLARGSGFPIGYPFPGSAPDLGALPFGETLRSYMGVALPEELGSPR